ncbi:MAG TPA: ABC transporter permease [Pirellulaceae bacterium]|jgi:hypothetical protein|nr:ABC transporter permease [Pirellulaceae bacterium]
MIEQFQVLPFGEWFVSSAIFYVVVVTLLIVIGFAVAAFLNVVRYGPLEAFDRLTLIAGTAFSDLVNFSPRRTWAIARLAFMEGIRRYVLAVFALFVVVMLFAGWFLEPNADEPAKLYISFVLTTSNYLALIMAALLSAFSLPSDIATKTIYTVITKPVRAGEILLGKIVGFSSLVGLMLAAMCVISYVFVVRGMAHDHTVAVADLTEERLPNSDVYLYRGVTTRANGHLHPFTVNQQGQGETEIENGHYHRIATLFDVRGAWTFTVSDSASGSERTFVAVMSGSVGSPAVQIAEGDGSLPAAESLEAWSRPQLADASYASVETAQFEWTLPKEVTGKGRPLRLEGAIELPVRERGGFLSIEGDLYEADGEGEIVSGLTVRGLQRLAENPDDVFEMQVGDHEGMLEARQPVYGTLRFLRRDGNPGEGIDIGKEGSRRGYVEGGTLGAAIFTYDGITPEEFPDGLPVEMDIGVFRTIKGDIERTVRGSLQLVRPITATNTSVVESRKIDFASTEFKLKRIDIPREIQSEDGSRELDLFEDLVVDGKLEIWLRCEEPQQYFGASWKDVYIRQGDSSFFANFVKGYWSLFLQSTVIIAFCVMFSTFLKSAVTLLAVACVSVLGFALNVVTLGTFRGIITVMREKSPFFSRVVGTMGLEGGVWGDVFQARENPGGGVVESAIRIVMQKNQTIDIDTIPEGMMMAIRWFDFFGMLIVWLFCQVVPNFSSFMTADFVARGYDIGWNLVAQQTLATAAYVLTLTVLGYFFLRSREVAA